MNQTNQDDSIRLCGTILSEIPRVFESNEGMDRQTGMLRKPKESKEILRYQESFFFQYSNVLIRKTAKTMGYGWIKYLQETIESNVGAILDGNEFNYDFSNGEKYTDILIIHELFHHGKKKEALHLVDELDTDGLSNDEMKFLGLLLARHGEYDRLPPFLSYAVANSQEQELEVLEAFVAYFKHQNMNNWAGNNGEKVSIEFFMDPKLQKEPPLLQCDFLDILQSYRADFENGITGEKESYRIYGLIANYHIWETGDFHSAVEYCRKGLKHGDTDVYELLGDIGVAVKDSIYAISVYETGFKYGNNNCLLGIANAMEQLKETEKQESFLLKAVELNVSGARHKLFRHYCKLSSEKQGDYAAYAWEQYQFLVEQEEYTPSQEELDFVQSYNQNLLQKSVLTESTEGILSAFYSLGLYCFHTGYQTAYWQKISTIIYSEHEHLDALFQYMENEWGDRILSLDEQKKTVLYRRLLAEMQLFQDIWENGGEYEYVNYQTFGEICELFHDRENAALYYSLYLRGNPALPRSETLYYEQYIDNSENSGYFQGMLLRN